MIPRSASSPSRSAIAVQVAALEPVRWSAARPTARTARPGRGARSARTGPGRSGRRRRRGPRRACRSASRRTIPVRATVRCAATYALPVTDRISLALVLHNHQPVGNFGWVIAERTSGRTCRCSTRSSATPGSGSGCTTAARCSTGSGPSSRTSSSGSRRSSSAARSSSSAAATTSRSWPSLPERDRVAQLQPDGRRDRAASAVAGRPGPGSPSASGSRDLPTSIVDGRLRAGRSSTTPTSGRPALDDDDLWGPYTTEDQGRLLTVFGSDKRLRYGIPFGRVEDIIGHLVANATPAGERLGLHGRRRREVRGLARHLRALLGRRRLGRPLLRRRSRPSAAIATMTPVRLARRASDRSAGSTCRPRPTPRWASGPSRPTRCWPSRRPSGRGRGRGRAVGALAARRLLAQLPGQVPRDQRPPQADAPGVGRGRRDAGRAGPRAGHDHLYQGQSNDCYWHGVFGGIYIPHMRLATHEHLIAAEDLADSVARASGATARSDGGRRHRPRRDRRGPRLDARARSP